MNEQKWSDPTSYREAIAKRRIYAKLNEEPTRQIYPGSRDARSIDDPGPELSEYLRRKRRRILQLRIYNLLLWANVVAAWVYVLITIFN